MKDLSNTDPYAIANAVAHIGQEPDVDDYVKDATVWLGRVVVGSPMQEDVTGATRWNQNQSQSVLDCHQHKRMVQPSVRAARNRLICYLELFQLSMQIKKESTWEPDNPDHAC